MAGGSDAQTTVQSMPSWAEPYAKGFLEKSGQVADTPYQQYGGIRTAGLNAQQYGALDAIQSRAMRGDPTQDAGAGFLQRTLNGGAQSATANPYGNVSAGPMAGPVSAQSNAYAGANPYLEQSINSAMGDMARNYNLTTAPQLDRLGAQSGSFGNSGVQQMQLEAGRNLQQQMGNTASAMRMQDYGAQQQLGENAVNRNLQAQQFNAGMFDTNSARNLQAQQFNAGMGRDWAARNDAMANNSFARQMQAAQMAPQYAQSAYNDASQLLNAGDRLQAQQQGYNNEDYQNWLDSRNYNANQLGIMGNALSRSFGGTTTQTGGSGSSLGTGLGTGIAAYAAGMNPYLAGGAALLSMFGR